MNYKEIERLTPEDFLRPELFVTQFDFQHKGKYDIEQYEKGKRQGEQAVVITISVSGTWGSSNKSGSSTSSYEGIGYHACTADLLRGFLESGAPIRVYRWDSRKNKSIYGVVINRRPKARPRDEDNDESRTLFKVYKAPVSRAQLEYDWPYFTGKPIHSAFDCTGKWFASPAKIKRIGKRVLVVQHWGLDI